MKFLSEWSTKAEPEQRGSIPAGVTNLASYRQGKPYVTNWDLERVIRDGYEKVSWVFRALDATAENANETVVRVRKGDPRKGAFIEGHPLVELLNSYPNSYEDAGQFLYRLITQYRLSDRGVFVEMERSNNGQVIGLHLLPPENTRPVPDPRKFISGFEVRIPGSSDRIPKAAKDVLWIRKPHPTRPYEAVTPLQSAGLTVDINFWARIYNRKFLMNDGRPGGILVVHGGIDDDDAEELRRRFVGGQAGAQGQPGRLSVIDGEGADWVDTAVNPRDAQYVEMMKLTKEEILTALGTPESVLGNATERTYANADAELITFWRHTIRPLLRQIAKGFDRLDGDTSTFVVFDDSEVDAIQMMEAEFAKQLIEELKWGAISREEYRERRGMKPTGDPSMSGFYIPQTYVPIATSIDGFADDSGRPRVPQEAGAKPGERKSADDPDDPF